MPIQPLKTIFCIIDPTTTRQRALLRASTIAAGTGAAVHAYCCFGVPPSRGADDREELQNAERARYQAWIDGMLAPLREQGITAQAEVECREDWRDALVPAAQRAGADLIIRATFQRTALQRRVLKTTDWILLRESPCPVMLVKSDQVAPLTHVLAAVNVNAKDEPHRRLTDQVIESARAVAELAGAELHAVNSYEGSMNFIHPPDLAKRFGVARNRAHVGDAAPEELISEVAARLGSPLVVIGSLARRGLGGAVVGNTAERILDSVQADLLCLVQPDGRATQA